jgi:predicted N-formylglutamate amidohydrolase
MGALLGLDEEPAVEVRDGSGPFVVVCEHASNVLPRALGSLGLAPADLERHIAFDPGAAELAGLIAGRTGGALVRQRYSRLAIDCNRSPELPDAIATLSETTEIPGNRDLSAEAREQRIAAIWRPFHDALAGLLDERRRVGRPTFLVTVHSFTPVYRGVARPWHAGIITTPDRGFADAVLAELRRDRSLVVGDNQPYSAKDNVDYTIRRHGFERGLANVMIEVRNDLLTNRGDIGAWAKRLTAALQRGAAAVATANATPAHQPAARPSA